MVRSSGQTIRHLAAGPYLPRWDLHLTRDLPIIGLTSAILADTASTGATALPQTAVFAGLSVVFATFLGIAERRRGLSDRLAFQAAANTRLETRVRARALALTAANARSCWRTWRPA